MRLSEQMIKWIHSQVKDAGKKGIVLGLSGGIDSAVVAVLAVKALGRNRVLGVILPCESHSQDEKYALMLAKKFRIKTKKVLLDKVFGSFLRSLPRGNALAKVNLKPRLRMCALYYFAHALNYLVAGTGNKSELAVGYFTKHGDGGVDILPLGELLKTDVRILARELNIPEEIIKRPPSAGLWKAQTDEVEMGITYSELDNIITAIEKKSVKSIPRKKMEKVVRMMKNSDHKRAKTPVFRPR